MPKKSAPVYLDKKELEKVDKERKKLGLERSPFLRMMIRKAMRGDE